MIREPQLWWRGRDPCLCISEVPFSVLVVEKFFGRWADRALRYTSSDEGAWLWRIGRKSWSVGWRLHDFGEFPLIYRTRRERQVAELALSEQDAERYGKNLARVIREARISHSKDGYRLHVVQVPLWALLAERGGEWLCEHTGNVLCAAGLPGWAWKVGVGRRDEDGWPTWNIGSGMFAFGQRFHGVALRRQQDVVCLPVSQEWVEEYFPETRQRLAFLED